MVISWEPVMLIFMGGKHHKQHKTTIIRLKLFFCPNLPRKPKKSIMVLNRQHQMLRSGADSSMDARLLDEPPAHRNLGELVGWFQPTNQPTNPCAINMRVHQIGGFKSSPNFMGNMFFSKKKMVELRPTENPVILHMCRELWFIFKIHHGKSLHFPFQIPSFFWANHPKHDLFYQDLSPPSKKTREGHSSHTVTHTQRRNKKKNTKGCLYMCLVYKWQFFQLVPEII